MDTTRVLIGHVSVDSGLLAIVDPCYLTTEHSVIPIGKEGESIDASFLGVDKKGKQFGTGSWGSAIAVGTGVGDGIFPVYRDGDKIVIDLADWKWDGETGRGVEPFGTWQASLEPVTQGAS